MNALEKNEKNYEILWKSFKNHDKMNSKMYANDLMRYIKHDIKLSLLFPLWNRTIKMKNSFRAIFKTCIIWDIDQDE